MTRSDAAMTHRITWQVEDDDGIPWPHSPQVICEAPEDAACHSVPDPPCDCESFSTDRAGDGRIFHLAYDSNDDEVTHWHRQVSTYCNYREWVSEDPEGCYVGVLPHQDHHDGVIEFMWDLDYYAWDYLPAESP